MKKEFLDNKREKNQGFFQSNFFTKNRKSENRKFSRSTFFPKNRRGDVPITILVIGVFAVCTLALFSFTFSISSLNKSFETLGVMEEVNVNVENNPSQDYYEEIEKREFSFDWDFNFIEEVVVFSVEYFGSG